MPIRTCLPILLSIAIAGCATVVMNDGGTVVIDWDPSIASKDRALEAATKSCKEFGKQSAVELTDVSANPALPSWMVKRRVTYKCQ
jgi:hypothetical protein